MRLNGSATNRAGTRPPVSPQIAALRRRVWAVRISFVLVVAAVLCGYNVMMAARSASLREPGVALAPSSQVFSDAITWINSHTGQLFLQATGTEYRGIKTGPLTPSESNVQNLSGRWYLRISNTLSVSEYGQPVITPVQATVTGHRLDARGRVSEITIESAYSVCWDRAAKKPRQLEDGEDLPKPDSSEKIAIAGGMVRHSEALDVVDRVVLRMNHRKLQWEPSRVERIQHEIRAD